MIKQREDAVAAFDAGGRPEMAQNERDEITLIREFMPQQMSPEETAAAVAAVVADVGASSLKDIGKVMKALKERYAGQMDFGKAGAVVKQTLGGK